MDRQDVKRWIVAGMMTANGVSCKHFDSWIMRLLFWRAVMSPMSQQVALRCFDMEVERAKGRLASELFKLREAGAVLTLTAQLCCSERERVLSISLHCSEKITCINDETMDLAYSLRGGTSAECLKETLLKALRTLGLSLTDIRGLTTDSAPVMRELGRLLKDASAPRPFYHQCCFVQGLDLAVLDTLRNEETDDNLMDCDGDSRTDTPEEFENNMDEDSQSGSQLNAAGAKDLIDKVRAAIRAFGKSAAASNESPSSARGSRRQLKLKLDGRANWTSTLRMLKGCLEHERALRLFLEEGVAKPCSLLDDDFEAISVIVRALDHVEEARGRLLLSDGNMESADMALQAMFRKLEADSTVFSSTLRRNLCVKILQRRGVASRLSRYLGGGKLHTDLDAWLDVVRGETLAGGDADLASSFIERGDITAEITAFREVQVEERRRMIEDIGDDPSWDTFDRALKFQHVPMEPPAVRVLMQDHERYIRANFNVMPAIIVGTMNTLRPVCRPVPGEANATRDARRFCQDRQDDSKFSDFRLLKTFYDKNKPWNEYIRRNPWLAYFSDDERSHDENDGELCSESECECEYSDFD